jgi:hypothetical protein
MVGQWEYYMVSWDVVVVVAACVCVCWWLGGLVLSYGTSVDSLIRPSLF